MHPFTLAQTAAAQEEIYCVASNLLCKEKLCCHGKRHNASCCALCPVCDVLWVYQDGGGDIKAWSGLQQPTLHSSPLEEQLFWRCKFLLAHRNTGRRGFRHPPSYHNAIAGWEEASLPCLNFPHVCAASESCITSFMSEFVCDFNFETCAHMSRTMTGTCCCYCLLAVVSFLRGLLICGITRSFTTTNHGLFFEREEAFPQLSCSKSTTSFIFFLYLNKARVSALWLW